MLARFQRFSTALFMPKGFFAGKQSVLRTISLKAIVSAIPLGWFNVYVLFSFNLCGLVWAERYCLSDRILKCKYHPKGFSPGK
jgi:hypothetical protein